MIAQIGDKWHNGEKQKVWLIIGYAYKNGSINYIGEDKQPVGNILVNAGESMTRKHVYITLQLWQNRVGLAMKVKRFDRIMAIGTLKKTQNKKTGTVYYFLTANFLIKEDKPSKHYLNVPKAFDLEDYRGDMADDPF